MGLLSQLLKFSPGEYSGSDSTGSTTDYNSVVVSGTNNTVGSTCLSAILSGDNNTINADNSSILGGSSNIIGSAYAKSFVAGSNITVDRACTTFVNNLSIKNIPTSCTGLPPGSVWNNNGVLNII